MKQSLFLLLLLPYSFIWAVADNSFDPCSPRRVAEFILSSQIKTLEGEQLQDSRLVKVFERDFQFFLLHNGRTVSRRFRHSKVPLEGPSSRFINIILVL